MDAGAKISHQAWFSAYGIHVVLETTCPSLMSQACAAVPWGWQPSQVGPVEVVYTFVGNGAGPAVVYEVWCDSLLVERTSTVEGMLEVFHHHAEHITALRARDRLFVHAGVIGWRGRALVVPGRSFSGKTTLVAALIQAGAAYYSDEFAVLDPQGLVHPYARPLSLRTAAGESIGRTAVEALGGYVGTEPLHVGLVVVTCYQHGVRWRPRRLSPGQALLALMEHTVAAQGDPAFSMPILRAAVVNAEAIRGKRGDAEQLAPLLLRQLAAADA